MNFLRSKNFALAIVGVTVAAFALGGVGSRGLLVGAVLCGVLWFAMRSKPTRTQRLYRELLRMAHGDRELVERLLESQAQSNPRGSRTQHLDGAIRRWKRDLN